MNNFLTFHAEATPDGVNIMYRSNDGMTERVEAVSYSGNKRRSGFFHALHQPKHS